MADPTTIAGIVVPAVVTLAKPVGDLLIEKYKAGKDSLSLADVHEVLNYGLEKLLALQGDKRDEVSRHITQKDPSHAYTLWTNHISIIAEKVASLNKEYDVVGTEKQHFLKRPHLEKGIKEALNDVIKLVEECPPEILVDKLPERVIKEVGVPSIEKYWTLQKAFQDIQALLQSDGVKCVSLHGQKGVGKTTIMQHLNNHFLDRTDFDMVIFIKVAVDEQTEDHHIMQKIAERINVDGIGDELEVSRGIQRVLKDKRYLLILDGIRNTIDGIWINLDISKDKKDSKVVIATHYPLAWKSACVQRAVKLNKLSPDEVWQMFQDIVGDNLLPDIPNALLVCKRFCCCLPLLINPIARYFKNESSLNKEFEEVGGQKKRSLDDEEMIGRALNEAIMFVEECPKKILVDKLPEPEQVIKEIGVPSIAGSPTLQNALLEVQQALLQTNGTKSVTLEGEDCVGKTIIMQHLNNFFYDNPNNNKFDVVIFIKVAADEQTDEDLHILQKIAKRMKVDIGGYKFQVAGRVRKVLENKRYLLMLDGLRQPSTLHGIWQISNDMRIGSKVVITTHDPLSWEWSVVDSTVIRLKPLSPTEAWEVFREPTGSSKSTDAIGEPDLGQDLLSLLRTWDFLHLILSYPMRIGYEDFLKQWIYDAPQNLLRRGLKHILYDESPLRYVQAVIPQDIATEIINGGTASGEKPLKQVPQPIILLATHLALDQLTLTLTSDTIPYSRRALDEKIQNIRFSARNDAEKRTVMENIQANSQIRATFGDLEIIDLNQIDDQTQREQAFLNLKTRLEQSTSAKSREKDAYAIVENNYKRRHLVLAVDGDGDKKLDPQKVGLPIHRDSKNVVVFITALSSAWQNDYFSINVDLTINTEDHSLPWELFCKIVGSELLHSSIAIQEIAVQIVEKCGGHLLAIILMAQSLKHVTDVQTWELALKKLRFRAREATVNAFLFHMIWGNVNSEAKKIRLLRCLMTFKLLDWKMTSDDELFDRWFSEQLVGTKEEAKSILQNFMECSLLLQFEDTKGRHNIQLPEDIKIILQALGEEIPENLREGALESTISDLQVLNLSNTHMRNLYAVNTQPNVKELNLEGCMVETLPEAIFKLQKLETLSLKCSSQLLELPPQIAKLENLRELRLSGCERLETLPQESWELPNLEVFDLSGTQITDLRPSLNFPSLRILLLGNNLNLMKIQSSFFSHVPLLTVLDLSRTSIHELPRSIFNLQQLRELYLKGCELFVELSPDIKRLGNLVTLDLEGTLITQLPREIQELRNLESLSLSFYNDSNHDSRFDLIPYGILTQLKRLKVLRLHVNSDNEWWLQNFEFVLEQISALIMLRVLDAYIPRDKFRAPIKESLTNFRFIVGHHKPRMISRVPPAIEAMFKESSRSLKFINGQDFPDRVETILSKSWAFFLDRHMTIKNLTQFRLKNLKQLRLCILAECNEIHSILDVEANSDLDESFCLQFLTIFYMKNLRTIINKPIHGNSIFCELKLLALHTCPELTTIFTMHSLPGLVNLEELIVEDCPKVSGIISCPSSERTTDFFLPRLRKISLHFVPELASISDGVCIGRNLEQMGLYYCPNLQSLSRAELSSEKLKAIRAEKEWWEKLQWSEAEWGQEDRPHKFNQIFSPIDEDLDILTQLTTCELMTSFNKENDSEETCVMSTEDVQANEDLTKQVTVPSPKPKYKHDFYQKPDEVIVTIFAKGVRPDYIVVYFEEQVLSVSINVPGEDVYNFQPRLFGKPSLSTGHLLSIQMKLQFCPQVLDLRIHLQNQQE